MPTAPTAHLTCVSEQAAIEFAAELKSDCGYPATAEGLDVIGPIDQPNFVIHIVETAVSRGIVTDDAGARFQGASFALAESGR